MRRIALVLSVLAAAPLARAVPEGMSPYIYGMHDDPGGELLLGPDEDVRGWITELRWIGTDGACGAGDLDFSARAAAGYGTIMRLDMGGGPPLPTDPAQYDGFAASFADCVARSRGLRVWIVGNEPNIDWGHVYAPSDYGEIYRRVLAAVDALPGGADHEILFAPTAPWASLAPWGDWDDGMAAAIDHVLEQGGRIDGVAIHPYTREFSVEAIGSDAWFPGRENKWHLHFRLYRDALALLAARGILCIPLYATEAGSVCDPPCDPYPDLDIGYFVALYEEIHAWNVEHTDQVIRAVTPYRWTLNDDGSGRDFCIGCSAPLVADMRNAVAMGRRWDDLSCSSQPGEDAGAPADAGPGGDAAPGADAGPRPDAGGGDASVPTGKASTTSGCSCRAELGQPSGLLLVLSLITACRGMRGRR
ncbi:MAG: hypothetical protein HYY06_15085 [Deltaproteobacteria bacterium]|nr:hypothetical protein [Deltaproteobacteria bacterium]